MPTAESILTRHLAKAASGPGSRGGKVIGTTRSGKPIYQKHGADSPHNNAYTKEDHEDAGHAHAMKMTDIRDAHIERENDRAFRANRHPQNKPFSQADQQKVDHHDNLSRGHQEAAGLG